MGLEPSLSADRCGIYLWTRRFVLHFYWALRFWEIKHQRVPRYNGGNVSFGPLYIAWYDREATYPSHTTFGDIVMKVRLNERNNDQRHHR